ncbi:acylglycerol kinase, mitochondrial-like [Mytilus edulis]|uniref:acylglycerol kinase, mitochondrial-like n=1 Tax=Mytilus edulis TaxID=6550 RepID=UPI0039F00504
MAFIVKTVKTVRNNWKKSLAAGVAVYFVGRFAARKYNEDLLRREFCKEAKKYGKVKIGVTDKPRRIIVFLNPASASGGAVKSFNKNAAPILHLAGIEVNVVKTEFEGQVKKFLTALEKHETNAVVVAGGDGTLLEAVTGFMRKDDMSFRQSVPLGVIPLGAMNRFARLLFGTDKDEVRMLLESAMAIVKGETKKIDVLGIQGEDGRTSFSLSGLQTGVYRDAEARKSKYWYFGPLKHRWTHVRTVMKEWPPVFKAKISYVLATDENTKPVYTSQIKKQSPAPQSKSWFSFLYKMKPAAPDPRYSEEEMDDSLDEEITEEVDTIEFCVNSSNLNDPSENLKGFECKLGPSEPNKMDVIKEGWRRINDKNLQLGSPTDRSLIVKKIKLIPEVVVDQEEPSWFDIDGENYEAMPIEIKLLKNRLNVFYNGSISSS